MLIWINNFVHAYYQVIGYFPVVGDFSECSDSGVCKIGIGNIKPGIRNIKKCIVYKLNQTF